MKEWLHLRAEQHSSSTYHSSRLREASSYGQCVIHTMDILQILMRQRRFNRIWSWWKSSAALSEPFLNKGYNLYIDNYFSSVDLLSSLLSKNILCVATTQTKRKLWPKQLNVKEFNKTLARGQSKSIIIEASGNEVECLVWKDKICVAFLNTLTTGITCANRTQKGAFCGFKRIRLYNGVSQLNA